MLPHAVDGELGLKSATFTGGWVRPSPRTPNRRHIENRLSMYDREPVLFRIFSRSLPGLIHCWAEKPGVAHRVSVKTRLELLTDLLVAG